MIKNLKKVISSAAAVALLASSASAFAVTFPDVDESASYANAVNTLTALGVINGDDNGKFNPDNTVTRAEFTKMVVEALGEGDSASALTSSQFTDSASHWAVGYIAQGVADGFINGYDEKTFGPDDTVTYAQAVKMLVCAVGYDTYATQQGGWPSGYMAYGSSLKIINGVSGVNNDTALTRAQCAVLINNAMKAPLCVVDGYEYTGLMGTVAVPKLVVKDDKDADYQTLLTDKHDAYVVKGRVLSTSKSGNLDKGEVTFNVEVADNFDDITYGKNDASSESFTMWAGETNAEDLLFTYAEAIVQEDEDADEYTILSITPYGNSKTVTFAADDVSDDDDAVVDEDGNTDMLGEAKIAVYKSEGSSSTVKYDLATNSDGDVTAELYVNGIEVKNYDNDDLDLYILNNPTGEVTLVDATEEGSTSTDGDYDYIMVTYYEDAVVDYVTSSATEAKIFFKASATSENRLQYDLDDEDFDITFTLDDQEIAYTDLQEYDVLSIAYNVVDGWDSSEFFAVQVARNTVTGTVTSVDTDEDENTARIDGQDYEANTAMVSVGDDIELNTEYTFYLDKFGKIAYVGEGNSSKNYGVIVGMYTSAGNDYATVRMITGAGEVVAYEVKDAGEQDAFYNVIKAANKDDEGEIIEDYDGSTITKTAINNYVGVENAVVTYTLSGGKVRLKNIMPANGSEGVADLEYKASSSKLGKYAINDAVTKVIDMESYLVSGDSTVGTMTASSFEDEAMYEAYVYDRNSNGDYRFILVLAGTSSLRPETSLAVIKRNPGTTDLDGTDCYETIVARDGAEDTTLYIEKTDATDALALSEGDVIVYTTGSKGYVEATLADGELVNIVKVLSAETDYDALYGDTVALADFSDMLEDGIVDTDNDNQVTYGTATEKEIQMYFGAIYKKSSNNLELIVGQTDGETNVNSDQIVDFALDSNTKTYVYDYGKTTKYRVSVGAVPGTTTNFWNPTFAADDKDKENIIWTKALDEVEPNFALVKVVEDDVTEVVVFAAK